MKKLIFLLVLISTFGLANAEKIFCKVSFWYKYKKVSNTVCMDVDMGNYIREDVGNPATDPFKIIEDYVLNNKIPKQRAVNSEGEELTFDGEIDGLNYVSSLGWQLESVEGNFYLFSKEKDLLREDDLCPYVRWEKKNKK